MRRTFDRSRDARGRPASITPRLITMIAMLGVLLMLIYRARDPDSWRWLTNGVDQPAKEEKEPPQEKPIPEKAVTAPSEPVSRGPVDADVEELAAAVEELQAVSDHTLALQPEEMPAYWRFYAWVDRQSFSVLQDRASKRVVFNDFMQHPDTNRRRIVQLDLNVRRVLRYDAQENPAGIKQVYEVWGWTDESQAWPYVIVTPHLPPGMPIGASVHERASFAGYFLKLQGYYAAGAAPKDKPLAAPLFIGRLKWQPSALRVQQQKEQQDTSWIWWVGAIGLAYGSIRVGLWWRGRTKPSPHKAKPVAKGVKDAATNRLEEFFRRGERYPYDFPPVDDSLFENLDEEDDQPAPYFRRNGNHDQRGDA